MDDTEESRVGHMVACFSMEKSLLPKSSHLEGQNFGRTVTKLSAGISLLVPAIGTMESPQCFLRWAKHERNVIRSGDLTN